jgi:hypothetical protein
MATESASLEAHDVCDVFLSHAGEQKKAIVDCVYEILVRLGGSRNRRNQCVTVFLDQHSLQFGVTPWEVMERTARTCRIGVPFHHGRCLLDSLHLHMYLMPAIHIVEFGHLDNINVRPSTG